MGKAPKLHPSEDLVGVDLERMQQLWDFFENGQDRHTKVLLIDVPEGDLSPQQVDRYREKVRSRSTAQELSMRRAHNAIVGLLEFFQNLDTCVVVAFQGQIDFSLFGLLLACDYRICSDETFFVNRILEVGLPPGSAVIWYLSRFLGFAETEEILLEGRSLNAREARELKLVNRLTSAEHLKTESFAVAEDLASKPAVALRSMMRAFDFLDRDLTTYLKHRGSGFQPVPPFVSED